MAIHTLHIALVLPPFVTTVTDHHCGLYSCAYILPCCRVEACKRPLRYPVEVLCGGEGGIKSGSEGTPSTVVAGDLVRGS